MKQHCPIFQFHSTWPMLGFSKYIQTWSQETKLWYFCFFFPHMDLYFSNHCIGQKLFTVPALFCLVWVYVHENWLSILKSHPFDLCMKHLLLIVGVLFQTLARSKLRLPASATSITFHCCYSSVSVHCFASTTNIFGSSTPHVSCNHRVGRRQWKISNICRFRLGVPQTPLNVAAISNVYWTVSITSNG